MEAWKLAKENILTNNFPWIWTSREPNEIAWVTSIEIMTLVQGCSFSVIYKLYYFMSLALCKKGVLIQATNAFIRKKIFQFWETINSGFCSSISALKDSFWNCFTNTLIHSVNTKEVGTAFEIGLLTQFSTVSIQNK